MKHQAKKSVNQGHVNLKMHNPGLSVLNCMLAACFEEPDDGRWFPKLRYLQSLLVVLNHGFTSSISF